MLLLYPQIQELRFSPKDILTPPFDPKHLEFIPVW